MFLTSNNLIRTIIVRTVCAGSVFFASVVSSPPADAQPDKTEKKERYNVILIVIDSLRADHLSCYGYPYKTSPAIDALALEGVRFSAAYSPAGYTMASMTSLFTGIYPQSHGMLEVFKDRMPNNVWTAAEILKAHGYETAWFSLLHDPQMDAEAGFTRGFTYQGELSQEMSGKEMIFDWVDKQGSCPFFLAMNIRKVHWPYFPDQQVKKRFLRGRKKKIIETREELL